MNPLPQGVQVTGLWSAAGLRKPSIFRRKRWYRLEHLLQTFFPPPALKVLITLKDHLPKSIGWGVLESWDTVEMTFGLLLHTSQGCFPHLPHFPGWWWRVNVMCCDKCCCRSASFREKKRKWRGLREGTNTWFHSFSLVVEMESPRSTKHRITCSYRRCLLNPYNHHLLGEETGWGCDVSCQEGEGSKGHSWGSWLFLHKLSPLK